MYTSDSIKFHTNTFHKILKNLHYYDSIKDDSIYLNLKIQNKMTKKSRL